MEFNIFKREKLPRGARKLISPRREFVEKAKKRFLAAFDARYHISSAPSPFAFAYKVAAAFMAVVAITTGASVYADTANVRADSPLYPLKRLSESVQLAFAKPEDKPQLRIKLAARRTEEIGNLEQENEGSASSTSMAGNASSTANPKSSLISSLAKDLHEEIDSSINDAEKTDLRDGELDDFCGAFLGVIATSSRAIQNEFSGNPGTLKRFEDKCGESRGGDNKDGERDSNTTSTIDATSTVPEIQDEQKGDDGKSGGEGETDKILNLELNSRNRFLGGIGIVASSTSADQAKGEDGGKGEGD